MSGLYFPPFHLDLERGELRRGARRVPVRPKALALLEYLAARPGRVLGAHELLHAVWPDVAVSAVGLKVCIRELRVALRDTASTPRFIETVPRRGYRFIAAVDAEAGAGAPAGGLFGREAELARLRQLLDRARAGQRQVVWVTGEPGIGKTAVVTAFARQAGGGAARLWVAAGQCAEQYGGGEAFLPVLHALGRLATGAARRQVVALLRQHAPTWLLQLPALLGPEERDALRRRQAGGTRERMLRELLDALDAIGAVRPLLVVLEDLHWSDVSTLDLLAAVARRQAPARVMVIATCRAVDDSSGGYPLGALIAELRLRRQGVELPLAPLGVGAVGDYLLERFAGSAALAGLAPAIQRHTEGNPLFVVTVVDHLVARGLIGRTGGAWTLHGDAAAVDDTIPDSLRQMVGTQLGQLGRGGRRMLEAASVCGVDFATDTVSAALDGAGAAVDAGLAVLARRRCFVRPAAEVERPDGTVAAGFAFAHVLYRQALYDGIAPARRARLHQRVGEHLEAVHGAQTAAIAAELAVHFEHGGDRSRAIRYHQEAGEKALARHAYRESAAELQRALSLLDSEPADAERIARELALHVALGVPLLNTRGFAAPEVRETYGRALALCRQVGETPRLFPVLEGLHTFYAVSGDIGTAYDLARQLERLARDTGDAAQVLEAHHTLGCMELKRGDLARARAHLEQAVLCYDAAPPADAFRLSGHDPKACSLSHLGHALWLLGHPDQALRRAREATAWAERLENAFSCALAHSSLSLIHLLRRDAAAAQAAAEHTLTVAEEQGFPHFAALAAMLRGWAVAVQGDVDVGLEQLRAGLAVCAAIGIGCSEYLVLLADAALRGGRPEQARRAIEEAERAIAASGEHYLDAELLRLRAALSDDASDATAHLQAALRRATAQGARGLELRVACQLAAWQRRHGQADAARVTLGATVEAITEGHDTGDVADARALLALLAPAQGRR